MVEVFCTYNHHELMHLYCLFLAFFYFFFLLFSFFLFASSEEANKISYQYRYPLKNICFMY